MKILLIHVVLLFTMASCFKGNGAYFEVTNESDSENLSVRILVDIDPLDLNRGELITIAPGETESYWTNMNSIPAVDGHYLLLYKLGGDSSSQAFGYYSKGAQNEKINHVYIREDSVWFKEIFSLY